MIYSTLHLLQASSHNASSQLLSHLFSWIDILFTMIWTPIGVSLMHAFFMKKRKSCLTQCFFLHQLTQSSKYFSISISSWLQHCDSSSEMCSLSLPFSWQRQHISTNFSSAFDTIDDYILVNRLHTDPRFSDIFLQWHSFYLTECAQYFSLWNHCSYLAPVHSVVPQGSVLSSVLFSVYVKRLSAFIDSHSILHHSFSSVCHWYMYFIHDHSDP